MASQETNNKPKPAGRPKPLGHTPGLTKTRRRYDGGGKLKSKKTS